MNNGGVNPESNPSGDSHQTQHQLIRNDQSIKFEKLAEQHETKPAAASISFSSKFRKSNNGASKGINFKTKKSVDKRKPTINKSRCNSQFCQKNIKGPIVSTEDTKKYDLPVQRDDSQEERVNNDSPPIDLLTSLEDGNSQLPPENMAGQPVARGNVLEGKHVTGHVSTMKLVSEDYVSSKNITLRQSINCTNKQEVCSNQKTAPSNILPDKNVKNKKKVSLKHISSFIGKNLTNFTDNIKKTPKNAKLSNPQPCLAQFGEISVTFKAFIEKDVCQNKDVYIVFGSPLGDWKSPKLLMKSPVQIKSYESVYYVFGTVLIDRKHCGTPIPYKYVLKNFDKGKEHWEQFFEDTHGNLKNRYLDLPHDSMTHFTKYDDFITLKHDINAHTTVREKAFVILCLNCIDLRNRSIEEIIERIQFISLTQSNQHLINKEGKVERFGQSYRPEQAMQIFLTHAFAYLDRSEKESFRMAIILSIFLSQQINAKGSVYPTDLRKIFGIFKLMVIDLNSKNEFISNIKLSDNLRTQLVQSIFVLLNHYVSIMKTRGTNVAYPCVYAYSYLRSLRTSGDQINQIDRDYFRNNLSYHQQSSMKECLNNFQQLTKVNSSFQFEFLDLCSINLFRDLITSNYLKHLNGTFVFQKLCHICTTQNGFFSSDLKSKLPSLKQYLFEAIFCLTNDEITTWQECIREVSSSGLHMDHEIMIFYMEIIIFIQKLLNAPETSHAYSDNDRLLESFTIKAVDNLKAAPDSSPNDSLSSAKVWSRYLSLLNPLEEKSHSCRFIESFREAAANWSAKVCEQILRNNWDDLNESVLDILLDSICQQNSNPKTSYWNTFLNKIGVRTSSDSLRIEGLQLSRLILYFPEFNENHSNEMFLLTTESDQFCKIQEHMHKYEGYLSNQAAARLTNVLSNLDNFIKLLETGDVPFSVLGHLAEEQRKNRLITIYRMFKKNVEDLVHLRLGEYEFSVKSVRNIHCFFQCIERYTETNYNLSHYMSFDENSSRLKDFCTIRSRTSPNTNSGLKFVGCGIGDENIGLINNFHKYEINECFLNKFSEELKNHSRTQALTLSDVFEFTRRFIGEFLNFCPELFNGSITLGEVIKHFDKSRIDDKNLRAILFQMGGFVGRGSDSIINTFKKLQTFFSIRDQMKVATTMKETINVLNITCDYSLLTKIIEFSSDSQDCLKNELNFLNEEMLKYHEMFSCLSKHFVPALETFNTCGNLIHWVRENIKNAVELKVFIDLANISAGESDMEVDQVLCFQQAVMAYSVLIFDCKGVCTLDQVFDACKSLSIALERDDTISQKFSDSSLRIHWLNSIKDRHGSVETSSLNLVNQITTNGEIKIKLISSTSSSFLTDICISFQEIHDNQSYERTLNLEDLKELESKLMLISASDDIKLQIERFTSILHQIILIQISLNKLLLAGCCFFSQFIIKGHFSRTEKVSVTMDLGHKSELFTCSGLLENELSSILTFLEQSGREWEEYILNMRLNNSVLNLFTTEQLMTLSRFLADIKFHRKISGHEPLMLLSLISKDVVLKDVKIASEISEHSTTSNLAVDPIIPDTIIDDVENSSEFDMNRINDMVSRITESYGYEEENILACILQTGNMSNEDAIVDWCLQHEDKRATLQDFLPSLSTETNPESEFLDEEEISTPVTEIDDNSESNTIFKQIHELWSHFLQTANINKAEDYVSFNKLRNVLDALYVRFNKHPIYRKIPPFLERGKPNLIIVENSAMHQIALSLYQYDKDQTLPQMDEILICNKESTPEELVLHCLRAFNDNGGKIYCFLNAELISFEDCCYLEKLFLKPVHNHNYQIVFLSSKEKDACSCIANALHRNRVNIPKVTNCKDIRAYLHRNLFNSNINPEIDRSKSRFRLITSIRSGEGKSLVIRRISEQSDYHHVKLPVYVDKINRTDLVTALFNKTSNISSRKLLHIDLYSNVREGIQDLLFSLSILGGVRDPRGRFWKCSTEDYYAVELIMNQDDLNCQNLFQTLLPVIWCKSPTECINERESVDSNREIAFLHATRQGLCHYWDQQTFNSEECQRPCQYLEIYYEEQSLDQFIYTEAKQDILSFLKVLLKACCVENPTWMELRNFWRFLNIQLISCEKSAYCNFKFASNTLPGFKTFVVKFLIEMSKDFATRSAVVSDESVSAPEIPDRNRWENNFHPYLFFNDDGHSFCFFGFKIKNGHLIDDSDTTGEKVISYNIMNPGLFKGLTDNGLEFDRNLRQKSQEELRKIYLEDLRKVLGLKEILDHDEGYELTADNVVKMMAIQMRFRADIPVMIMGETGTGKTRLIRFICDLQKRGKNGKNFVVLKCHGGIACEEIHNVVRKVIDLARDNVECGIPQTVLFFDEANTTNAIGAIKEVMCDKMVNGEPIPENIGLQFVAAVNPYREHSEKMIEKLENAGLGYHMKAENTEDKLAGKIPMRRLVYRVTELPRSILPLIWDFGKLDDSAEEMYVSQMVENRLRKQQWSSTITHSLLVSILTTCQRTMRIKDDECSFVSLRDVERCLDILTWFHEKGSIIMNPLKFILKTTRAELPEDLIIQLILAIGCSYYVRLENRQDLWNSIQNVFFKNGYQIVDQNLLNEVIHACQDLFIKELKMEETISRNEALKENVWIMAICIELRIPLFLVGKPGSSKSLAKTLVSNEMQGEASKYPLFKQFKEIQLVSFQCSPVATADGILSTFRQCQKYQMKQNLDAFVSVVVLDEIGLAEDSPKMPLKALHPLLEDGCLGEEKPDPYKKVGFIGISNWALDPAKMNRGLFVSRGKLSREDLIITARGICKDNEKMKSQLEIHLSAIVDSFLLILDIPGREYYGLRDFYSLIKMLYQAYTTNQEVITDPDIKNAVCRCFGGYFNETNPAEIFISNMSSISIENRNLAGIDSFGLIKQALKENEGNRYLLLLTKNNAALRILLENPELFTDKDNVNLIFGSSFPQDQEYMQLCKNINKIKLAMETGQTVILCNLSNLYESLYDALNQSYVYMGGSRYVDLGLGMHRVKCRVHPTFRLVVVSEDTEVFGRFPIPLINRFEKHYLGMETLITDELNEQKCLLEQWISRFSKIKSSHNVSQVVPKFNPEDVFMGYHEDTPASLIIQSEVEEDTPAFLKMAQYKLISCASPDSIGRLKSSNLTSTEIEEVNDIYHLKQCHNSLAACLNKSFRNLKQRFLEITTHCRLLTFSSQEVLAKQIGLDNQHISLMSLHQIKTDSQFKCQLKKFMSDCSENSVENVLIIQCILDNLIQRTNLIECARYCVKEIADQYPQKSFAIVLLIQIPRIKGGRFIGFSPRPWHCVHLDELNSDGITLDTYNMKGKSLSHIIEMLNGETFRKLVLEMFPRSSSEMEPVNNRRILERIDIFTQCLKSISISSRFLKLFKAKILKFQTKLESELLFKKNEFLLDVSMDSVYLAEGHTFKQSLWLTLQDKIRPTFTSILQYCDFTEGLDHLVNDDDWRSHFYLKILETIDMVNITPSKLHVDYISSIPFSWAIFDLLEKIKTSASTPDLFHSAFKETKFGHLLQSIFELEHVDVSELFVKDMILWKFPLLKSGNVLDVCIPSVIALSKHRVGRDELHPPTLTEDAEHSATSSENCDATNLYLAFDRMDNQFQMLSDAQTFYGNCFNRSMKISGEHTDQCDDIDILVLNEILNDLEPKNNDHLFKKELRMKWLKNFKSFKVIFQKYSNNLSDGISVNEELVKRYRRLEILSLFTEFAISRQANDKFYKHLGFALNELKSVLKGSNDLTSSGSFHKIIKVLSKISIQTSKLIFSGGVNQCFICLKEFQTPVALQCNHVACLHCLREVAKDRSACSLDNTWNCPYKECKENYPADFAFVSTSECKEIVQEHRLFRENMTSFFLELLQRYTFCDGVNPDAEVVKTLLDYIVTNKLPEQEPSTKQLSPFDGDGIDTTPTIRSFIFRQILKGDWKQIDEHFKTFYKSLSGLLENSGLAEAEFFLLLLYSIEDSLVFSETAENRKNPLRPVMSEFVIETSNLISTNAVSDMSVFEKLHVVARLRICLSYAANIIHRKIAERESLSDEEMCHLQSIERMMLQVNENCLFKYLLKELSEKHSTESIMEWKKQFVFPDMMHPALRNNCFDYQPDYFSVLGEDYLQIKEQIHEQLKVCKSEDIFQSIECQHELMNIRLASFFFRSVMDLSKQKEDYLSQIEKRIESTPSNSQTADSIVQKMKSDLSPLDKAIYGIAFHFHEMLLMHGSNPTGLLTFFYSLCFNPDQLENTFFPTMPQDIQAEFVELMKWQQDDFAIEPNYFKKLYKCGCGHIYGVGDCGGFEWDSICPDCGGVIGEEGCDSVEVTDLTDTSQTGYLLGPSLNNQLILNVRELTSIQVLVLRFMMHTCMILSSEKEAISQLMSPTVPSDKMEHFLMSHLKGNFIQLSARLGKSEDHTKLYLHLIIDNFARDQTYTGVFPLETKNLRLEWESEFIEQFPNIYSLLDDQFKNFQVQRRTEGNEESFKYLEEVFEDKIVTEFQTEKVPYVDELWKPRVRISLENINLKVSREELADRCPLMTLLIENRDELAWVNCLIPILQLQSKLIARFNRKLDISELETKSIREFLSTHIVDTMDEEELIKLIDVYLDTFNHFHCKLKDKSVMQHYNSINTSGRPASIEESLCGILFPVEHGLGQCALTIVQHLIHIHNSVLREYTITLGDEESAVNVTVVDKSQLMVFEAQDLEMMLLLNSEYSLQSGRATEWTIDLENMERQVENRFFVGRVIVDKKSLPMIKLFNDDKQLTKQPLPIPQQPLSSAIQDSLEYSITSLPDVCLFLNHCQTVRHLLTLTVSYSPDEENVNDNFHPKSTLKSYISMLQLNIQTQIIQSEWLDKILLEHIDDLIVFLKIGRAKRMISLNQNPWQGLLPQEMQTEIDDDCKERLDEALHHIHPRILLPRYYCFIEENIVTGNIRNPKFSISDCIYHYLYEQDDPNINLFQEYLPQNALIQHATSCFAYFVNQIANSQTIQK